MQTVILGAGISGLTAAMTLSERYGESPVVFEQNAEAGGLCRIQEIDGFKFDIVSHVLHFRSPEVEKLVRSVVSKELVPVQRSARIYFRERYVPYPFQTHLGSLPWPEKISCMGGFMRAWFKRGLNGTRAPQNFEEWIEKNFGSGIARHFMIPYNTALWGAPPREMSTDWVRPFVPSCTLTQAASGFLLKRAKSQGYNSVFHYPTEEGMGALVTGMLDRTPRVEVNKRAVELDLERKVLRFQDGDLVHYERLISTVPLRSLLTHAKGVPENARAEASKLRCTTLLNITCCLRRPLPHGHHWVYFPEPDFPFFRLVFPSNISASLAPKGCSIVAAEISNPEMARPDEVEQRVHQALVGLGLIQDKADIAFTARNFIDHAYPVHDLERGARVAILLEFLKSRDVWSIGRFGGWQYSSIEDAILEALETAREVATAPASRVN